MALSAAFPGSVQRNKVFNRVIVTIFYGADYGKLQRFAKCRTSADVGMLPRCVNLLISQRDGSRRQIQREATFGW